MDKLVEQIKKSMRIRNDAINDVIKSDIEAAVLDLIRVGVQPYMAGENKQLKEDNLIHKAIELYSKGEQDFQGKGEKYTASYEKLRDSLSLCGEYNEK